MTIGELVGRVVLDARGFISGLATVTGTVNKHGRSWAMLAATTGAASYVMVRALRRVINEAADFEYQMRRVNTINLLADDALRVMSKDVQKLGIEFGKMPGELTNALYDIASACFFGAEGMEVLDVSTRAAIAGMTDIQIAARAITGILNAYGMSASEAGYVSDVLFTAVKYGVVTFRELANEIGQAASTAALVGVPLEDVAAAFATITRAGINASEAGVSINRAMLAYIKPAKQAKAAAAELGIELTAANLSSKGLAGAIDELVEKLGITEGQMDRIAAVAATDQEAFELLAQETGINAQALADVFVNVRALRAILPLTRRGVRDFTADQQSMADASGATQEALNEMLKTFRVQWGRVKSAFQSFLIDAGTPMLDMLKGLANMLVRVLEALRKTPPWAFKTAVIFGTLTAAILSLVAAASSFLWQINLLKPALAGLHAKLAGAGGVSVASTAAAIGLTALALAIVSVAIAAKQAGEEGKDYASILKNQELHAKMLGIELGNASAETGTLRSKVQLYQERILSVFGAETAYTDAIKRKIAANQKAIEIAMQEQGVQADGVKLAEEAAEKEAELTRAHNVRAAVLKKLQDVELSMQDEFYGAYLEQRKKIDEEFEEMRMEVLGGPILGPKLLAQVKAGTAVATDEQKRAIAEIGRVKKLAEAKADAEYIQKVKEKAEQERQERLQKTEQTERERLDLFELYADHERELGRETFDQWAARIQMVIDAMRRADAERARVGDEPFYTADILRQEMQLYTAREQEEKRVADAIREEQRARQELAQNVVDALKTEEQAITDLVGRQRGLIDRLLEMGDITEGEWTRHMQAILRMMAQVDKQRRAWAGESLFMEDRWEVYETFYRRQQEWEQQLAEVQKDRNEAQEEHMEKLKELQNALYEVTATAQERRFEREREQIRITGFDREDLEEKIAEVNVRQARALIEQMAGEARPADLEAVAGSLEQAIGLLVDASDVLGPRNIQGDLSKAQDMLEDVSDAQEKSAREAIRAEKDSARAAEKAAAAKETELQTNIRLMAEALATRTKDIASTFYNEFAARIKELGKVLVTELGGGEAIARGAPGAVGALAGGGTITINVGAGVTTGSERDLIRKVRDALTDELNRARR